MFGSKVSRSGTAKGAPQAQARARCKLGSNVGISEPHQHFIDAIFGHSLGPGVSTRVGWGRSPNFSGSSGVLPLTRAIAWGDPANCKFPMSMV